MQGSLLITLALLSGATYTLQSGPPLDLCSPEPSIDSSASLPSQSIAVSASVRLSTAPKGIRSWPKDKWESIYNFFKDKLHVQRLSLREDDRLNVELSDQVDTSDGINRLDITVASVDSTEHQSSIAMETRAGPTKLHRLASRRSHRTCTPTAVHKRTASSTADSVTPTPSPKSYIPHWSYKKHSIAAAIVFVVIAAVAFIALTILLIRRLRQSWKRYKKRKRDYVNSKYFAISPLDDNIASYSIGTPKIKRSRELSLSRKSRSTTKPYVAEEATSLGAVARAICANPDAMPVSPLDSVAAPKQSEARLSRASVTERLGKPELPTEPWRAGLVPKQVVIVSPLNRMVSGKAAEIGWQSSLRTIDEVSVPEPEAGPQRPIGKIRREDGNQTPSPDQPSRLTGPQRALGKVRREDGNQTPSEDRLSRLTGSRKPHGKAACENVNQTPSTDLLYRLPSIERSTSPLFEF
ncbi:hypothetical protein CNMCM6106_009184 [Aspergillus hiratsukae]|uniref:Uncharacterized protein n=1 Tax=Aspergillus hiratsukae TaxID=1194566 RepID=A0A8H6UQQ4_9EURO|nr:hypothetical protein CNMCM6106_009184 [Aspergillus hiratsukae]